jgi:hypothetical protein
MKMTDFWDMAPFSLQKLSNVSEWDFKFSRRRVWRCLHHQDDDDGGSTYLWNVSQHSIKNTAVHPRRFWASTFQRYVLSPSSGPGWQYASLKRRSTWTRLHGAISQTVSFLCSWMCCIYTQFYEPGSSVSGKGLDDRAIEVRFPADAKDFFSSLCVQTGSGAQPASCTISTGGPLPGLKSGRGVARRWPLTPV